MDRFAWQARRLCTAGALTAVRMHCGYRLSLCWNCKAKSARSLT